MTKTLDKPLRNATRGKRRRNPKGLGSSRQTVRPSATCPPKLEERRGKAGWSPERRAKQAELIRVHRPWTKSTGPRTDEGKARSASNALKHGFRSRAFIERIQEERQLVRDAAETIALTKMLLRALAARRLAGTHLMVWTGDPEVEGRPSHPNPPVKPL
jgi:hypothetical protein